MIISEMNAVFDLVLKATSFYTQFQDGWFKGSSELQCFEDKVLMLSAKHSQWSEQLQRYGVSEDKHLLLLVTLANQALEKHQESIRKLQRSPLRRWKKRVFPGELSYFFDKVFQIVDAGPQLLATKVDHNDLLERYTAQNPTPLPFGRDRNYVPIVDTILKVRNALENAEGPRVITVYGEPGMGKSCLAKHLAIHYQEERQEIEMGTTSKNSAVFPHGVCYLFCGRHADKRLKQLQLELLQSLGFGTGSESPDIDSATTSLGVQADYQPLPSHQLKLTSRLAKQKLLVILDDLWEETVLQKVLVPANGVKYLVTSQMRDVFVTAKKIRIDRPTEAEARNILANYTDGLPMPGQFPLHIQRVADEIIRTLDHHPLSLANIGISINSSRATDTSQWEVIRKDLYLHIEENDLHRPPAYDRPYSLPVSASMMLMVESIPSEAQRLLFLMALLGGQRLPEPLVKFFYKFIQTNSFALKYYNQEKFLEDKCLIEIFSNKGNRSRLDCHSLRSHYIRDKKRLEVRSLGSQILIASGPNEDATTQRIQKGDTEQTLVAILGAIYYRQGFKDIVGSTLQKHMEVLNDGAIPRSLNIGKDTLDVVHSARLHKCKIGNLIWLLKSDHEEGGWKNQAHEHAKKIIIKFVCQGRLEDDSMASLLKHPQTISVASAALDAMFWCHAGAYIEQEITFSNAYSEIMQTLLALVHDNGISVKRRAKVMGLLLEILRYDSNDTILQVAAQYKALLAMDSEPNFQLAMIDVLRDARGRGFCIFVEFPGLFEDLMELLLFGKDHNVRLSAASSIHHILCESNRTTLTTSAFPNALQGIFDLFISEDMFLGCYRLHEIAGTILSCESSVPKNRIKFREIQGIAEGLRAILGNLEIAWRETLENDHRMKLERRACVAASILGYLGLEENLRDTTSSLSGVQEGLLFLQLIEVLRSGDSAWDSDYVGGKCYSQLIEVLRSGDSARDFDYVGGKCYCSTVALTVLCSNLNSTEPRFTTVDPVEDFLKLIAEFDEGSVFDKDPTLKRGLMAMGSSQNSSLSYVMCKIYWTRVLTYLELRAYVESLSNLDLAQRHLSYIIRKRGPHKDHLNHLIRKPEYWQLARALSQCRMFLQAMQGDYAGAFRIASAYNCDLAVTGVLKRLSGDLQGALDDLNAAVMNPLNFWITGYITALPHRGYVKYLMGDEAGAREDAEVAHQIERERKLAYLLENSSTTNHREDRTCRWELDELSVSYLGFCFSGNSIRQWLGGFWSDYYFYRTFP